METTERQIKYLMLFCVKLKDWKEEVGTDFCDDYFNLSVQNMLSC